MIPRRTTQYHHPAGPSGGEEGQFVRNPLRKLSGSVAVMAVLSVLSWAMAGVSADAATVTPAITPYTVTATTAISNRPDSGDHGDWALDTFSRTASATLVSQVALSNCGGATGTGACYHWTCFFH